MTVQTTRPRGGGDGQPTGESLSYGDTDSLRAVSWSESWAHREELLRIARRRSVSHADAEDAVSEAILRSCADGQVDSSRAGAWLTSVTTRLCADAARERARHPKRVAYQLRQGLTGATHEQAICDRAEATWLSQHLDQLPQRQRRALELRAEGRDVGSIAAEMGTSYKVTEGLLQRARAQMRTVLARTAAWVGGVLGVLGLVTRRRGSAAVPTTLAAAGVVMLLALTQLPNASVSEVPPSGPLDPPIVLAEVEVEDEPSPVEQVTRPPNPSASTPPATPPRTGLAPPEGQSGSPRIALPTLEPRQVRVGVATVTSQGTSVQKPEEGFIDSLTGCLEDGLQVSAELVGCSPE